MDYKEHFKDIPIEQKRKDLLIHPMMDANKVRYASNEVIEELYFAVFSSLDQAMREVMGESMFEDDH